MAKHDENPSDPRAQLPLVAPIPPGYGPGFCPTAIACGAAEVDGRPAVVLQLAGAFGVMFSYLPPEVARQIAANIDAAASAADRGILRPTMPMGPGGTLPKHYTMNAEPGHIPIGGGQISVKRNGRG